MKINRWNFLGILVLILVVWQFAIRDLESTDEGPRPTKPLRESTPTQPEPETPVPQKKVKKLPRATPPTSAASDTPAEPPTVTPAVESASAVKAPGPTPPRDEKGKVLVRFKMEDGVAVAQGDLVLGVPVGNKAESGFAQGPQVRLWPNSEIPYFIPPGLAGSDRILEAIEMFASSPIRFVPFSDQHDVLVFQEAKGACKSYVGLVGGQQPIWINSQCGPKEIAHELLHALGFVHEQNRTDRDRYLEVFWSNIENEHRLNFEILPDQMMKVTELSLFDFESIMMYPADIFSRGGPTMRSKIPSEEIAPRQSLSPKDLDRLVKAYGFKN